MDERRAIKTLLQPWTCRAARPTPLRVGASERLQRIRRKPRRLARPVQPVTGTPGGPWQRRVAWVTSHVFRKTCATLLDEGELSARQIADQLGHAKVSMIQDTYLGRRLTNCRAAETLDRALDHTLGVSASALSARLREALTCSFAPPTGLEPTQEEQCYVGIVRSVCAAARLSCLVLDTPTSAFVLGEHGEEQTTTTVARFHRCWP